MAFCQACGHQLHDSAMVCVNCGSQVAGPASGSAAIPTYLVPSILSTLFCCLPLGIVAIVYAAQVTSKQAAGDHAGALHASKQAKLFVTLSAGVGVALLVLWVVFGLLAAGSVSTAR